MKYLNSYEFNKHIIIGNETLYYEYDLETRANIQQIARQKVAEIKPKKHTRNFMRTPLCSSLFITTTTEYYSYVFRFLLVSLKTLIPAVYFGVASNFIS